MTTSLSKFFIIMTSTTLLVIFSQPSFALPIDWHGVFGVDTTLLGGARRVKSAAAQTASNVGSQEVAADTGNKQTADWQSYAFKLNPTMIINDAATFKAELTTGYANGGFLGDSFQTDKKKENSIPVYYHSQSSPDSTVSVGKAYLELYSDTATYLIGRHSFHWGLGAIYNEGKETWDRHSSNRDGVTMKLKIGNFLMTPFWSKVSNGSGLTSSTSAKELGVGLLYDNQERDIAFGLHYTKRDSNDNSTAFGTAMDPPTYTVTTAGKTSVKITDLFLKKELGKFNFAVEVPLVSGDLGKNAAGNKRTYSAKAIVLQSNFNASDAWILGFDAGQVDGNDGSATKFSALYLNPNYQVANILFRYNLNAIGDHAQSIYDSYITNTRYLKIRSTYNSEKWIFDTSILYAKAREEAVAGKTSYNHTKNKIFTATTTQSDSLGTEVDINATYKWNKEINVGIAFGYLATGDYFAYTNDSTISNETKNSVLFQLNTSVTF